MVNKSLKSLTKKTCKSCRSQSIILSWMPRKTCQLELIRLKLLLLIWRRVRNPALSLKEEPLERIRIWVIQVINTIDGHKSWNWSLTSIEMTTISLSQPRILSSNHKKNRISSYVLFLKTKLSKKTKFKDNRKSKIYLQRQRKIKYP